jgi:hypothetical protein
METMAPPPRTSDKDGKAKKPAGPSVTAHKALITRNLRLAYDEVAGEPIPDKILDLLAQMDKAGKSS